MRNFILVVNFLLAVISIYMMQVAAESTIRCTKPNEEFAPCGDVCPIYCDTPLPRPCPKICHVEGGCVCKKGYVRKSKQNPKCILRECCPKRGG